jgi:hypothetical protein
MWRQDEQQILPLRGRMTTKRVNWLFYRRGKACEDGSQALRNFNLWTF